MIDANSLTLLIILPSDTPCRKYYLCICLKTPKFSFVSFRPHFYSPHLSSSFTLYSSRVLFLVNRIVFSTEEKNNSPWLIQLLVGIFWGKGQQKHLSSIKSTPSSFSTSHILFQTVSFWKNWTPVLHHNFVAIFSLELYKVNLPCTWEYWWISWLLLELVLHSQSVTSEGVV